MKTDSPNLDGSKSNLQEEESAVSAMIRKLATTLHISSGGSGSRTLKTNLAKIQHYKMASLTLHRQKAKNLSKRQLDRCMHDLPLREKLGILAISRKLATLMLQSPTHTAAPEKVPKQAQGTKKDFGSCPISQPNSRANDIFRKLEPFVHVFEKLMEKIGTEGLEPDGEVGRTTGEKILEALGVVRSFLVDELSLLRRLQTSFAARRPNPKHLPNLILAAAGDQNQSNKRPNRPDSPDHAHGSITGGTSNFGPGTRTLLALEMFLAKLGHHIKVANGLNEIKFGQRQRSLEAIGIVRDFLQHMFRNGNMRECEHTEPRPCKRRDKEKPRLLLALRRHASIGWCCVNPGQACQRFHTPRGPNFVEPGSAGHADISTRTLKRSKPPSSSLDGSELAEQKKNKLF